LFDLSFFPIIYPYLLFTLKILYSFFFFFQLPVFFLFFILKKKVNVTFFIQNRKHFFIFCLVFGTFFSTPEVLNQIILSCILLFFFEVILFFSFIRFFLIRLKEG
jgi:Sec-independent protein secretion pathway component TatC